MSADPMGYRLTEMTFSYDGAPDSKNGCPVCGDRMSWHELRPFDSPEFMECEDCGILCDVETEAVWVKEPEYLGDERFFEKVDQAYLEYKDGVR